MNKPSSVNSAPYSSTANVIALGQAQITPVIVSFDRHELGKILNIYGRMVAAGLWRDYTIDHLSDRAIFSIYRRTSEIPLFRIEKVPKLSQKQGAYAVIATSGLILKRGHSLEQVLRVLDKSLKLITSNP